MQTIFGSAFGTFVGNLIQTKKDGGALPPLLDKVAGLGIQTEKAAVSAASDKAVNIVGSNTIKFSPYIIAGLVGVVLLLLFTYKSK